MSWHTCIHGPRLVRVVALPIWLSAVICGSLVLIDYETRPSQMVAQAGTWPADAWLERSSTRPTLCMFAHPRCPCTRASIEELAALAWQCQGLVEIKVLFFCPTANDRAWRESDLVASAKEIPHVDVEFDCESSEAKRFGAMTSGQVMLFDRNGDLLFNGGITNSRGHVGGSAGKSEIISLLETSKLRQRVTDKTRTFPVYGCALCEAEILPRKSSQ